jgi:hypothetical protein
MSAHLASVPTTTPTDRSGIECLSPAKLPRAGLSGETRQKADAAMLAFDERIGARAVELRLTDLDLVSVHAQHRTTGLD